MLERAGVPPGRCRQAASARLTRVPPRARIRVRLRLCVKAGGPGQGLDAVARRGGGAGAERCLLSELQDQICSLLSVANGRRRDTAQGSMRWRQHVCAWLRTGDWSGRCCAASGCVWWAKGRLQGSIRRSVSRSLPRRQRSGGKRRRGTLAQPPYTRPRWLGALSRPTCVHPGRRQQCQQQQGGQRARASETRGAG